LQAATTPARHAAGCCPPSARKSRTEGSSCTPLNGRQQKTKGQGKARHCHLARAQV
jgi:hypothetical protein